MHPKPIESCDLAVATRSLRFPLVQSLYLQQGTILAHLQFDQLLGQPALDSLSLLPSVSDTRHCAAFRLQQGLGAAKIPYQQLICHRGVAEWSMRSLVGTSSKDVHISQRQWNAELEQAIYRPRMSALERSWMKQRLRAY
jgi:hypothetical protein